MNDIEQRFQAIKANPDTVKLEPHGRAVSNKPIFSEGYMDCNAVALLHPEAVALSHYHLDLANPRVYIKMLVEKLTGPLSNAADISAVVVCGEERHFTINKKILEEYGIPIVAEHSDGLRFTARFPRKDLIVVPKTLEVLMYTKPDNYVRITPPIPQGF